MGLVWWMERAPARVWDAVASAVGSGVRWGEGSSDVAESGELA